MSLIVIGITSCGGGHTCDAYRKSDYTKQSIKNITTFRQITNKLYEY